MGFNTLKVLWKSAHSSGLKVINMVYKNASYIKLSNTHPSLPQPTWSTHQCLSITHLPFKRSKMQKYNSQQQTEGCLRLLKENASYCTSFGYFKQYLCWGMGRKCLVSFLIICFWPMPSTSALAFWLMSLTRKQTISMLSIKTYKWLCRKKLPVLISSVQQLCRIQGF